MPQYLSPGVYVEEVKSSIQPIAGVGTSTAGFIGTVADAVTLPVIPGRFRTDDQGRQVDADGTPLEAGEAPVPVRYTVAPAGAAQLVTSWESFKNQFGDFQAGNSTLAHAVYGFFNNGGTRCWVTRVAALSAAVVGTALDGFSAIDEIAIVAVPGALDAAVQQAVIDHCERMGDRFAVLDGQRVTNAAQWTAANIKGTVNNSNYAALYFPWISVYDPTTDGRLVVPPSGHMAGIYARVDTERGVHKAPANVSIRGALGVESRVGKADQDGLNPAGINAIRDINGAITVWGARTLGGDANGEWKYINVRRLFLYLRESIDEGTQWVVFEPNTPALWSKITRNATAFLTNVWRSGALFGNTPAEAFYVRCDASTNPPEVRDLGQVVTEIGVAVVRPAEFVIFRISQWSGPGNS
ncbi:MAG TPA: phage tail sheath subtilisin-like domain-containing protein [Longimicrobiaceae bacterium]